MNERPIREVLAEHGTRLLAMPGVVGVAEGERPDGAPCLVLLVETRSTVLAETVPSELEGWPVEVRVTGELEARGELED